MISPILSAHDTDTVQLRGNLFIAQLAYDYRTSQAAIIAALRSCIETPSQPAGTSSRHAPAAQTDEGVALSSSSVTPSPETPTPLPDAPDNPADALSQPAEAKTSDQEASPEASGGVQDRSESTPPTTLRDRIVATHREHPEWPAKLLARACGTSEEQVRVAAQKRKLTIPSWWDYQRKQKAKTTESLRKPPKAKSDPSTPTPTPEPAAKPATLAQRIANYVADHPDATAREVADALGAKLTSISWAAQKAGVTLRKFDAAERSEATRRGIAANKPVSPPVSVEKPASPFAPPDIGDEPQKIRRPAKTRFYLREKLGQGQFLHMSCQGLTEKRIHAWIGTEQQLLAVRKAFAASQGLVEEVAQ